MPSEQRLVLRTALSYNTRARQPSHLYRSQGSEEQKETTMVGALTGLRVIDSTHACWASSTMATAQSPVLGQHTDDILRRLGYDEATIATYHAEGVV